MNIVLVKEEKALSANSDSIKVCNHLQKPLKIYFLSLICLAASLLLHSDHFSEDP